uniref:Uncharacterized protein n=1 Tax=Strongyloides papillosus TaxID=174720 RepID=A0A0N5BN89_STREA
MSITYLTPPPPYVMDDSKEVESPENIDILLPHYFECLNDEDYERNMPPKYILSEWYENEKELAYYKGAQHIYEETYFLPLVSKHNNYFFKHNYVFLAFINNFDIFKFPVFAILYNMVDSIYRKK